LTATCRIQIVAQLCAIAIELAVIIRLFFKISPCKGGPGTLSAFYSQITAGLSVLNGLIEFAA